MTQVRHTRRGAMIALALSLCTAAAVASTLAGCGKKTGGDDADKGGGGGSLLKVGFAQEGAESDWRTANTKSIREAGTKANGVELSFTDSQGDVQQQVKALDSFVLKQLDVVAFSPKEEKGWDPVLKRLKAAGIPVIVSDRDVVVADPALQPVYIGSDLKLEGHRAGDWLAAKTDGQCKIVILEGNVGGTATIDRTNGFTDAIKAHPGMTVIDTRNADFDADKAKDRMGAILKSPEGKGLTAVYAENDEMAVGAIRALTEAGFKPGKDVTIVSVDGTKQGLQAIVAGTLNCTIECNPLLGPAIMDTAKKLHAGQKVPPRIISDEQLFDDPAKVAALLPSRKY